MTTKVSVEILSERAIQCAIYHKWSSTCEIMVPNYTPSRWHECDVFGVTNAGYFIEYEIKLTLADFRADATKKGKGYDFRDGAYQKKDDRTKHQRLAESDTVGPSRFYYVVPDALITESDLPFWAGLIYAKRLPGDYVRLKFVRHCPRIHTTKLIRLTVSRAMSMCWHRMWREKTRRLETVANIDTDRRMP